MKKTGAEILWECVSREGVTHVFGYPGGAILPAYDALGKHPSIHHVLVRHEQGATHMADGYARASGRVGVAVATSGPGATNMVTGIATAMLDSSPIVCITGQVGSKLIGSDAFQEIDITGITLPITKHNYLVTRAEEVAGIVREAFLIAKSGRPGPVLIDITKDAQQSSCEFDWETTQTPQHPPRPDRRAAAAEYLRALELINSAQRPLILAGHGILLSGALPQLRELAEKASTPVAMTLLGIGAFPASHPLNLGMMGMHGEAWVNHAIQEADLLIALGMRFDDRVTGNLKTYAPNAKKIHVEIDPAEVNKNVPVDVALIGDLRSVLDDLLPGVAVAPASVAPPLSGAGFARQGGDVPNDVVAVAPPLSRPVFARQDGDVPHDVVAVAPPLSGAGFARQGGDVPNDVVAVAPPLSGAGFARQGGDVPNVDRSPWLSHIAELKGQSAVRDIQNLPDNGHLYAAHVISDLWHETAGKSIVVSDVGQHQMWEAQYYKHDEPHTLITSGGLGTMGFALPAAIGAKFARPDEELWVVVGDGGFQMTMCELATVAQEGLNLKIAIINNGYLGMVRQWQEFFYDRRYHATPLVNPDFAKLAQAYGLEAMTVTKRSEVIPAVQAARSHRGTVVVNFCVEQEDSVFPMVPAGASLDQMIRRPSPLVETATDT